ncbi:HepT-like ribonuclease domain-containing protein [Methanothrix sp.]|uniref:HepT-like ribonuclease domain-containing protein n=1 Tax=Methanothrix sp. TaxID=90426 RepID=UPI0032AF2FC5
MKKDLKILLAHIVESINLVEKYSHNKTLQDFMGSRSLQDMIIHRIEIIGEAVKHLPEETKNAHPEVSCSWSIRA